ncbi:MAG: APC family permease [Micromonosporaceae bacterium]|nr:APC family permease [Micromonosporaceae bacterium]
MSSPIGGQLKKDTLGVPSVIFFVMSAAAPLTVVAGVITIGYGAVGVQGLPFAYILMPAILAIFAIGYVAMSRHISNAGAFYTYVTHGLGRPLGVGTAWMALLAYNALQVGLYGVIGAAASVPLEKFFGITAEWWVIALIVWAIVAILGVLRVDINGRVLAVLLCAEILIVLIYDFAYVTQPGPDGVALTTLNPANLFGTEGGFAAVGAVLVLSFLGFVGFEASVVFSEESKNPKRTIALATFLSLLIIGGTYALTSWAMSVATGPGNISSEIGGLLETGDEVAFIFIEAGERLPEVFVDIGSVLFATSVLAASISFHNTVARYTFALGRERVFPIVLGKTGRRSGAPISASILQSVIGLVVIVLFVVFNLNPVLQLFYYGGNGGGFGVMLLVTLTALSILFFFRKDHRGESVLARVIAPVVSFVLMAMIVYFAVDGFNDLLGVEEGAPVSWIIPALYPVVCLLGVIYALILKATRPEVYQSIGLGANSSTGIAVQTKVDAEPAGVPSHR